ncbi:hypothetical protein EDD40_8031 [Saccharothrix texasensis]|uniref:Uncharacterized protein n=1 Tax=Saccharothrix texasensis TaxID=103734 RepID=A0A3N1HJ02_9PSEU|nr:hypothetical protein EDD40_8031 [Saccharothrix texasensis]
MLLLSVHPPNLRPTPGRVGGTVPGPFGAPASAAVAARLDRAATTSRCVVREGFVSLPAT